MTCKLYEKSAAIAFVIQSVVFDEISIRLRLSMPRSTNETSPLSYSLDASLFVRAVSKYNERHVALLFHRMPPLEQELISDNLSHYGVSCMFQLAKHHFDSSAQIVEDTFGQALSLDSAGIVVVLENSYGQDHTFVVDRQDVLFVGQGDLHDATFDDMENGCHVY